MAPAYDLLLRGGMLVDGTGSAPRHADVAVRGDRIAAILEPGSVPDSTARAVWAVGGLTVAPGFIDCHTHDDRYALSEPDMPAKLSQGVTTVVTGNCGLSLAPLSLPAGLRPPAPIDLLGGAEVFRYPTFAAYLDALDAAPAAANVAALVGHSTLRVHEMGEAALHREATQDEAQRMRMHCEAALAAGAFGVSAGTFYPPAQAATLEEMLAVFEPLRGGRGVFAVHLRDEGDRIDDALREAFAVGRHLDVSVVVSHHKLAGRCNHGRSVQTLEQFRAARHAGVDVGFDVYPYNASSTMLKWERIQIADRVLVAWSTPHPELAGQDFSAACAALGLDGQAAVDALSPGGAIYFTMSQDDVDRLIAHPLAMVASDGLPHDTNPHPRLWGTFPRVLGHYARQRKLLTLQQAVQKMTWLPACRFGLTDRGQLAPGAFADITVFDAERVCDNANFEHPRRPATGIAHVLVNGVPVRRHGQATGARPGRCLRRLQPTEVSA